MPANYPRLATMADNGLKTDSLQLRISFPFEIVCSHRFTASPVSLFPQVADACDDESARTATLAGGFFFCVRLN